MPALQRVQRSFPDRVEEIVRHYNKSATIRDRWSTPKAERFFEIARDIENLEAKAGDAKLGRLVKDVIGSSVSLSQLRGDLNKIADEQMRERAIGVYNEALRENR